VSAAARDLSEGAALGHSEALQFGPVIMFCCLLIPAALCVGRRVGVPRITTGLALRPARVLLPAGTCGTGCRSASRGPPDHDQDMSWVSCCLRPPVHVLLPRFGNSCDDRKALSFLTLLESRPLQVLFSLVSTSF
jgi:hypothetical protein